MSAAPVVVHDATTSPAWNVMTGTATKYALLGVNVALGIVLMPFTVRHLGTAEYGLWMLVASLTYYFQLLDLGYGSGLVRHVADADARGDVTAVNNILSTFVVVYAGLGLLAAVGTVGLIFWAVPRFWRRATGRPLDRTRALHASRSSPRSTHPTFRHSRAPGLSTPAPPRRKTK